MTSVKDLPWLRQVFFYGILGGDTQKEGENMNITVYLGANEGNDPALKQAVWELGTWIGESGNDLIYGGSKVGLMGVIAESVLRAGIIEMPRCDSLRASEAWTLISRAMNRDA